MIIRSACLIFLFVGPAVVWAEPLKLPEPRKPVAEQSFVVPPWPRNTANAPWGLSGRGGGADIRVFRFSPDGQFLVGMTNGAWELEVREVASGKGLGTFGALELHGGSLGLSPVGTLALVAQAPYGQMDLWDWKERKLIRNLDEGVLADSESIDQVAFLDERRCILGDLRGNLWIWDLETADELDRWTPITRPATSSPRRIRALAVSTDRSTVAVVEDNLLYLVVATTGKLRHVVAQLSHRSAHGHAGYHYAIRCLEFSRDSRMLALGCENAVRLYDLERRDELPPLTAHSGGIRALHFTADGKSLLSLGRDDRLLTWSLTDIDRPWTYAGKLSPEQVQQTCDEIDFHDPWQSYVSMQLLRSAPEEALIQLHKRLRPVSLLTAAELEELAARLESDDANIRRGAVREVGGNVSMVFDLMRERSREQLRLRRGDAEARAGMDKLMRWNRAARRQLSAAEFHDVGLIQLLPRIGTDQARALAKAISGGASADIRTATAEESLTILDKP